MDEQKKQDSPLFGKIELLAIKACIQLQLKERFNAFFTFKEAYELSAPNDILMPFIELGKDMRTLTTAALREPTCDIPRPWLEMISRKAASYAKYQSLIISKINMASGNNTTASLSLFEKKILKDIYYGLSRSEIAIKYNLSINTINPAINNIYEKLKANNMADVIRITAEQKLI